MSDAVTRRWRLVTAFAINLGLTVGLLLAGHLAHSTGLVADAGHNVTDAMAIALALVAQLVASRPPTSTRSWGMERASILAALANGVVLVAVTMTIVALAVERLLHPIPIRGWVVILAAGASLVANVGVVVLLIEGHRDLSIRSALVHAIGDALSAAVVAVAGIVALVASGPIAERIDPIASLIVAAMIVFEALRITRASVHVLLEGVPPDVDLDAVRTYLLEIDGVSGVHDLHVWSLSSQHRALSAHLVVDGDPTLSEANVLLNVAHTQLAERFNVDHATMELETAPCEDDAFHP